MGDVRIGKENVGRIAERIVANELEARGFIVRDLNIEGLAANADLLAVKDGKVWQIQVKGATYDESYGESGWWFGYGFCTEEHIRNSEATFFNRHSRSFRAEIVVLVCVRKPSIYQCVILPVSVAEKAAQLNLGLFRVKKPDGADHKPGKVWFSFYDTKARTAARQEVLEQEKALLRPHHNRWDFDIDMATQGKEMGELTLAVD